MHPWFDISNVENAASRMHDDTGHCVSLCRNVHEIREFSKGW